MRADHTRTQQAAAPLFHATVFAALFLLVLSLQYLSGAYASEFGGYPDEPAHYATSVMVHDFLLSGHWAHPMAFARDFYAHYPKVAFGHWPPLLYLVQGVWMLFFSVSRTSVLLELALTTTVAAFLVYRAATRYGNRWTAVLAAVLLVSLPVLQTYTSEEMAESLLLVTTFQAAVFFALYLERGWLGDIVWFSLFATLAILTKGNGWALALVPPIALLLTGKWSVLRRPSFWIPVPIIGVLCIPWQIFTLEMANRGWTGGSHPNFAYTAEALREFAVLFHALVGWAVLLLALAGIWRLVLIPLRRFQVRPFPAVLFALLLAIWVFHSVVPAGVEDRKLINALPPVILFAIAGALWLASRLPVILRPAVPVGAALLFLLETFTIPKEKHYGFTELGGYIESEPSLQGSVILVSSERDGEGLVVSEIMMQDRRPSHYILRANKVLSSSDWNGNISALFCKTPAEIMTFLRNENVRAVVVDSFPPRQRYQHHQLILQAIRLYPAEWTAGPTFGDGRIAIYRLSPRNPTAAAAN